jgi:predicted GIY-YIG superfamily endonuclease
MRIKVTSYLAHEEDANKLKRGGIYMIECGSRYYIGSTEKFDQRFRTHHSALNRGTHRNKVMQNAYNKHGDVRCSIVEVLKNTSRQNLIWVEQHYLDMLHGDDRCMNLMKRAETGVQVTRAVICDGVTYESVVAVARHLGVEPTHVSSWLAGRDTVSPNVSFYELKYADGTKSKLRWGQKEKYVLADGRLWQRGLLVKRLGCAHSEMTNWITGRSPIPEKYGIKSIHIVGQPDKSRVNPCKRKVSLNGVIFDSVKDAARSISAHHVQVGQWLAGKPIPAEYNIHSLHYA